MKIIKSKKFSDNLENIAFFIAKDSVDMAIKFIDDLEKNIEDLDFFPYKYRKSEYFNNEEIRDFVFKGYTIPYFIDKSNQNIVLLTIFKYRLYT